MAKCYFVRLNNTATGAQFYKFGYTGSWDVEDRVKRIAEDYPHISYKIMKSVYHSDVDKVKKLEEYFLKKYPKNIWINEKLSGVTEIVSLPSHEVSKVLKEMSYISNRFYNERKEELALEDAS
jgi:hypothetical protein